MSNLHNQIMNLPCNTGERQPMIALAFKLGHRDARHAAAELALAADVALATANERIRGLEELCNQRIDSLAATYVQIDRLSEQITAERAVLERERLVSDKLVTALQRIAKLRIVGVDGILDDYVDIIADADLRKGQA